MIHKRLFARQKSEQNLFKEQYKMIIMYENVRVAWACVWLCLLCSAERPSGSVSDLCVCEAEVTAEVISLMGKKILACVSFSFFTGDIS